MTTSKKHISQFGKTFDYLKNAELRDKEKGDAFITVDGATVSGNGFQYVEWHNMVFKNCDFVGAYEIKLSRMINVRFEDCRFAGIFGFGVATNAHFLRCGWAGPSIGTSRKGSKNVVFEECKFVGETSDPNHRGGVGSDGEAKFIRCTAKWFTLEGYEKLELLNCELDTCNIDTDSVGNSGENFSYSSVLIDNCKLRGLFKMVSSSLQSLTIRDTVIDNLDLSGASVKGDTLMERVVADRMNLAVTSGGAISLRSVKVNGSGQKVFYLAANRFSRVLLDDCTVSANLEGERAWIGGAPTELAYAAQPALSQSVTFRNSTLPRLDASYLNTARLLIENTSFNHLVMSHARVGYMEFIGAQFSVALDLSNAQVKQFKHSGGTHLKKLAGLKLDGSNVKIN